MDETDDVNVDIITSAISTQISHHTLVAVVTTVSKSRRKKLNFCNFRIFCNFKIERFRTGKIPTGIMWRVLGNFAVFIPVFIFPGFYFSRFLFFPMVNKLFVIILSKVLYFYIRSNHCLYCYIILLSKHWPRVTRSPIKWLWVLVIDLV